MGRGVERYHAGQHLRPDLRGNDADQIAAARGIEPGARQVLDRHQPPPAGAGPGGAEKTDVEPDSNRRRAERHRAAEGFLETGSGTGSRDVEVDAPGLPGG